MKFLIRFIFAIIIGLLASIGALVTWQITQNPSTLECLGISKTIVVDSTQVYDIDE